MNTKKLVYILSELDAQKQRYLACKKVNYTAASVDLKTVAENLGTYRSILRDLMSICLTPSRQNEILNHEKFNEFKDISDIIDCLHKSHTAVFDFASTIWDLYDEGGSKFITINSDTSPFSTSITDDGFYHKIEIKNNVMRERLVKEIYRANDPISAGQLAKTIFEADNVDRNVAFYLRDKVSSLTHGLERRCKIKFVGFTTTEKETKNIIFAYNPLSTVSAHVYYDPRCKLTFKTRNEHETEL